MPLDAGMPTKESNLIDAQLALAAKLAETDGHLQKTLSDDICGAKAPASALGIQSQRSETVRSEQIHEGDPTEEQLL